MTRVRFPSPAPIFQALAPWSSRHSDKAANALDKTGTVAAQAGQVEAGPVGARQPMAGGHLDRGTARGHRFARA
jgi:hypothetical protein